MKFEKTPFFNYRIFFVYRPISKIANATYSKIIVLKLHQHFNWIGTKAKMFQQHEIFRFYKIKKSLLWSDCRYSGLTAGCNLKLATYVDIRMLKTWRKLHYPAANQTQFIGPQKKK